MQIINNLLIVKTRGFKVHLSLIVINDIAYVSLVYEPLQEAIAPSPLRKGGSSLGLFFTRKSGELPFEGIQGHSMTLRTKVHPPLHNRPMLSHFVHT